MAIREIPLPNDVGAFSFLIDLDNRTFNFIFRFNDRTGLWGFDIQDVAGTVLLGGIPLFSDQLLIDKYQHDARLPQGNLFAQDLVNVDLPATRDNLGIDIVLLYDEVV